MNTAAIKVPITDLNPEFVRDLQEKYPDAQVTVTTTLANNFPKMDDDTFWDIIALLDWGRKRAQDIIAPAILELSTHPEAHIFSFEDLLAQKLHALDTERHAAILGWKQGSHFSTDGFLYARCAVVANGRDFYTKVLNKPDLISKENSFEPLLYLAEQAYRLKTGKDDYDYLPCISYETFSNEIGWPNGPKLEKLLHGSVD
jgi:Protein of unknown function (DUF4240)